MDDICSSPLNSSFVFFFLLSLAVCSSSAFCRDSREVKLQRVQSFWDYIGVMHFLESDCLDGCSEGVIADAIKDMTVKLSDIYKKSPVQSDILSRLQQCTASTPNALSRVACLRRLRQDVLHDVDDTLGPIYTVQWQKAEEGFKSHCGACHIANGHAQGYGQIQNQNENQVQDKVEIQNQHQKIMAQLRRKPRPFNDPKRSASNDPLGIFAATYVGRAHVGMPAFQGLIDAELLWSISFYLSAQVADNVTECHESFSAFDLRRLLIHSDVDLAEQWQQSKNSSPIQDSSVQASSVQASPIIASSVQSLSRQCLGYLRRNVSFDPQTPRLLTTSERKDKVARAIKLLGVVIFATFALFFVILKKRSKSDL